MDEWPCQYLLESNDNAVTGTEAGLIVRQTGRTFGVVLAECLQQEMMPSHRRLPMHIRSG